MNYPLKKDYVLVFILFLCFFALYAYTAPGGVFNGDTGEIATTVNILGLAHPTGFPLYMLSGKLFTLLIPWKDVAFRLNIYSAVLTAGAVALIFISFRSLNVAVTPSILASLIFGMGRNTIWSNAGTANVYALSLFLALVLFNLLIQWQRTNHRKFLYWYAFLFGLSLGNHVIIIIMAIPFLFMLWQEFKLNKQIKISFYALLFSIFPLFQYMYIQFAYARNTIITWGDISSFRGFIDYITQRDFAFKMSARTIDDSTLFLNTLVNLLSTEFTVIFFIIALLGFVIFKAKYKLLLSFIAYLILANISIMFFYGNSLDVVVLYRYLFLIYIAFAISLALFLDIYFNKYSFRKNKPAFIVSLAIILLLIGLQFKAAFADNNRHTNYIVSDYAENLFLTLEKDSIIFTIGDAATDSLWYLQSNNYRTDVVVIADHLLTYDWYVAQLHRKYGNKIPLQIMGVKTPSGKETVDKRRVEIIKVNFKLWPIYLNYFDPVILSETPDFSIIPLGILYKIESKNWHNIQLLKERNDYLWDSYKLRGFARKYDGEDLQGLIDAYPRSLFNLASSYINLRLQLDAKKALEKALILRPDYELAEKRLKLLESTQP